MSFSLSHLFHAGYNAVVNPIGATKDLFGGGGHSGQKAEVAGLSAQARAAASLGAARSEVEQRRALGDTQLAYGGARNALGTGRTQAIQAVGDAGKVAQGRSDQNLASRGLYNTTIAQNAQQGISAGVSRSIADIDSHYAEMLGNLGIGEANATTGIRQGIAQNAVNAGNMQAGLYGQQANFVANEIHQDPNAWLNSLLGIAGTAAGTAFGKSI